MSEILHHLVDHSYFTLFSVWTVAFQLTKHTVVMWIASILTLITVGYIGSRYQKSMSLVPRGALMNSIELLVEYVRDEMVYPIMGETMGRKYLHLTLTLFTFILVCNLLGLIPAISGKTWILYPSATATGNPSINFALATLVLLIGVGAGIKEHGFLGYLKNYLPHGVPLWIAPIMWPIEVIGTVIRHAVLAIRLLANMLAGHAVLFGILFGAVILVEMLPIYLGVAASAFPVLLGLLIYGLELLVALIQAYVFALLSVIYLDMQVSGH